MAAAVIPGGFLMAGTGFGLDFLLAKGISSDSESERG